MRFKFLLCLLFPISIISQTLYYDKEGVRIYYEIKLTGDYEECDPYWEKGYVDTPIDIWEVNLTLQNNSDNYIVANNVGIASISTKTNIETPIIYCTSKKNFDYPATYGQSRQKLFYWSITNSHVYEIAPGQEVSNTTYLYLYRGTIPELDNWNFQGYRIVPKPKEKKKEPINSTQKRRDEVSSTFSTKLFFEPDLSKDGFGGSVNLKYAFAVCNGRPYLIYGFDEVSVDYAYYEGERYYPHNLDIKSFNEYFKNVNSKVNIQFIPKCDNCSWQNLGDIDLSKIPKGFSASCSGNKLAINESLLKSYFGAGSFRANFFDGESGLGNDVVQLIRNKNGKTPLAEKKKFEFEKRGTDVAAKPAKSTYGVESRTSAGYKSPNYKKTVVKKETPRTIVKSKPVPTKTIKKPSRPIVGSWERSACRGSAKMIQKFNENGTGSIFVPDCNRACAPYGTTLTFNWRTSGDTLYLKYTSVSDYCGKSQAPQRQEYSMNYTANPTNLSINQDYYARAGG